MMLLAPRVAIRSIAPREALRRQQMIPVLITFLYGLGVAGVTVLTAPPLFDLAAPWTGRWPLLLPFLGLGLAFCRRTGEREPGRRPAFSRRPALLFASLSLASLFLLPRLAGSFREETPAGPLLAILFAAPLGLAGGRMLRSLVLYAGGRRTQRMHLWISTLSGAVVAPLLLGFLAPIPRGPDLLVLMALALLLAGLLLPSARALDMPVPDFESWRRGPLTTVGVMLLGAGYAGIVRAFLIDFGLLEEAADRAAAALPVVLLFVAGLALSNLLAPRLKRAGVRFGGMALLTVAAVGVVETMVQGGNPEAAIPGWFDLEAFDWRLQSFLFRFGLPSLFLGLGLAALPRLYGGLQLGDKILHTVPLEERRGPVGGALRVGGFLVGLSIGWPLFDQGLFEERAGVDATGMVACLAAGGLLLVVFDPYAGMGRKLMTLAVAGGAAILGARCFL